MPVLKAGFIAFSVTLALQETVGVATRYTAGEVLTFFAAAGVLITGVGAVIVNIIVALRTGNKMETVLKQGVVIEGKVQEVHGLTNANLSLVKAELAKVTAQNTALHELVSDLRSERDKAAITTAALALPPGSQPPARPARAADTIVLEKIEANTDATAKNTANKEGDPP